MACYVKKKCYFEKGVICKIFLFSSDGGERASMHLNYSTETLKMFKALTHRGFLGFFAFALILSLIFTQKRKKQSIYSLSKFIDCSNSADSCYLPTDNGNGW